MKLKKFLKSDSKKTYFKGERTYNVKQKVKKLKNIFEEEAKNTIDRSRRESVYASLDGSTPLKEQDVAPKVKKSKRDRKRSSIAVESSDTVESAPQECGIVSTDSEVPKKKKKKDKKKFESASQECDIASTDSEIPKKKKKKDKKKYEVSKSEVEPDQSVKKSKKKKNVPNIEVADDNNLDTSVSEPLLTEPQSCRESRTIYIGNLPVDFKKKKLLKVLKQYGTVEKMWTRGVKSLSALPKKIALIKGKLPENHPPLIVHALFKTDVEAHNALKLNGELYDGNRLRVTMSHEKEFDSRKGVFVGNLPFEVQDDDLFSLFQQCGEIAHVRVVRDAKTGAGKGFGYVNFKSIDAVELALNMNEEKLNGREIRVQRLFSPGKKKKMDKKKEKKSLEANKAMSPVKKIKSLKTSEERPKKKKKLNVTDLKKKIMAKKLSIRSKKSAP